jgi:hypothetical protein
MQTYVAEIDGRAIFAFRSIDDACAQAWLDIHTVMRRRLERIESGGQRIWNGRAQILARKADPSQAEAWTKLSGEVADRDPREDPDYITVWLISTSDEQRPSKHHETNEPLPEESGSDSTKPSSVRTRRS